MRRVVAALSAVAVVAAAPAGAAKQPSLSRQARDAGCVLRTFPSEGVSHTEESVRYASNPPTSGPHHPDWADDGVYASGDEPAPERWVHSLEHGRIVLQYRPGTAAARVARLRSLYRERLRGRRGYHQLLFANTTDMPYEVAAVAWRRYVGCKAASVKAIRVLRAFRVRYVDRGPELAP